MEIRIEDKLERLFCMLLDTNYKTTSTDELCMQKILTALSEKNNIVDLPVCSVWIQQVISSWKQKTPEQRLGAFFLCFTGLVIEDEKRFESLQRFNAIGQLSQLVKQEHSKVSMTKQAYVRMSTGLLKHDSGVKWIIQSSAWRDILSLYHDNNSVYVKRDSQEFIVKLLLGLADDDQQLLTVLISEILQPLLSKDKGQITECESTLELVVKVTESFLTKNCSKTLGIIFENTNLETIAWDLLLSLKKNKTGSLIELTISKLLILIYFVSMERQENGDKILPSAVATLEKNIYKLFSMHISKNNVTSIMNIVTYCQICWSKISGNVSQDTTNVKHFDFDTQLVVFQLLPILISLRSRFEENECLESYSVKLFQLTSEGTQRLAYMYRDILVVQPNKYELARKAILSVMELMESFHRRIAIISYQALMYYLKDFVCEEPHKDGLTGEDRIEQHPEELRAVLDGLISLIRNFQITWRESVETICLFGFAQHLLQYPMLSSMLVVQSLKLMQVAIQNFMPPNLALLMNTLKGSSVDQLGPILCKRLHDVSWEVRDTALDVLQVVSSIAEVKFPAFQEHILENELCVVVLSMAINDEESYVRASAIKCLGAMVKVQKFWNEFLAAQELPNKIVAMLFNESEGIVRCQAAALLKEIYEHQSIKKDTLEIVFSAMATVAIHDLHWEVKVNSLTFWQKVIDQHMSDQGMIDGIFPSVTFSKEHRKIVTLTENEIKLRLNKVLEELGRIGCLMVLLSALKDHDLVVARKAADIIVSLKDILTRHGLTTDTSNVNDTETGVLDTFGFRARTQENGRAQESSAMESSPSTVSNDDNASMCNNSYSDKVIEDIISDTDMNLLSKIYTELLDVQEKVGKENSGTHVFKTDVKMVGKDFLSAVVNMNPKAIVNERLEWVDMCSDSKLISLIDDMLTQRRDTGAQIMDCY